MTDDAPAEIATLQLLCPAKVNIALSVAAPEPDTGMHPIASWMVAVDFGDTMHLARLPDGNPSRFHIAFDEAAITSHAGGSTSHSRKPHHRLGADSAPNANPASPAPAIDWPLEKDLAYRAHRAMEQAADRSLPVSAELSKQIPTGAGLGGGSSDAAAMIVAINQLFTLDLSIDRLCAVGATLGSDVPFLVNAISTGCAGAIVSGLGQRIEPAPPAQPLHLALGLPPFACPTGPVYVAFDKRLKRPQKETELERVRQLAAAPALHPSAPFNDLAIPAADVEPRLAQLLTALRDADVTAHVTGSGAAVFAVAPHADAAKTLARRMHDVTGIRAIATRTIA